MPTSAMNTLRVALLRSVGLFGFTASALALTITEEVNPAYVQKHSNELSVKVVRRENGLIDFTITHNLSTVNYHFKLSEFIPAGMLKPARGQ